MTCQVLTQRGQLRLGAGDLRFQLSRHFAEQILTPVPRQTDLELELHRRGRGPLIERALQASHPPAEPFDLGLQLGNEVRARFGRRSGWPVGPSSQSAER